MVFGLPDVGLEVAVRWESRPIRRGKENGVVTGGVTRTQDQK